MHAWSGIGRSAHSSHSSQVSCSDRPDRLCVSRYDANEAGGPAGNGTKFTKVNDFGSIGGRVEHNGCCTDEKQATAPIGRCRPEAYLGCEWLPVCTSVALRHKVSRKKTTDARERARCPTIGDKALLGDRVVCSAVWGNAGFEGFKSLQEERGIPRALIRASCPHRRLRHLFLDIHHGTSVCLIVRHV